MPLEPLLSSSSRTTLPSRWLVSACRRWSGVGAALEVGREASGDAPAPANTNSAVRGTEGGVFADQGFCAQMPVAWLAGL